MRKQVDKPRGPYQGNMPNVPGLLLAALLGSFPQKPAAAGPKGPPGHGHRCSAVGV
jgi:hypothetical protein